MMYVNGRGLEDAEQQKLAQTMPGTLFGPYVSIFFFLLSCYIITNCIYRLYLRFTQKGESRKG